MTEDKRIEDLRKKIDAQRKARQSAKQESQKTK